jgi:hypothetical protein
MQFLDYIIIFIVGIVMIWVACAVVLFGGHFLLAH